jgi:hypothetical protein
MHRDVDNLSVTRNVASDCVFHSLSMGQIVAFERFGALEGRQYAGELGKQSGVAYRPVDIDEKPRDVTPQNGDAKATSEGQGEGSCAQVVSAVGF